MSLASAVVGALRPVQAITWLLDDDTPLNLSGADLSGVIRNRTTGATRAIEGTLTVTDAANGSFTWSYHANDVSMPGHFEVQFTAVYDTGETPARTVRESWFVDGVIEVPAP